MYEIKENEILRVVNVSTATQIAVVKTHFCMSRRIVLTETSLQWQSFDLDTEGYVNSGSTETFALEINGEMIEVESVNGYGEYTLVAPSGEYAIRTVNPSVENAEITVVIT